MTLGQFAVAVGASPRWVLNAVARLGLHRRYNEPLARRMALCRFISEAAHTPLPDALRLADRALREADPGSTWRLEGKAGVSLVVDLPRFFTAYGANLALALNAYGEKPRGRRPSRRGSAIERARAYGIDVSLLDSALRRTPEERGRRVAEDMAFLSEIRGKLR
jgi:hypothetical protein